MGLIDSRDYYFHTGQYQKMSLDSFGQTTVSSTNTISCYVYTEEDKRLIAGDERVERLRIIGLIPSSVNVGVNDKMVTVVDRNGNAILSSGKITSFAQYNQWDTSAQFHQVFLEVN